MRTGVSFVLELHRVFDMAPPGSPAAFFDKGRQLNPQREHSAVYSFYGQRAKLVEIICPGYQRETVPVTHGGSVHVCLYPTTAFLPPEGWQAVRGGGISPGEELWWPDERYELELLDYDHSGALAFIRSKPELSHGHLLLSKGDARERVTILEMREPHLFSLSPTKGDYRGGAAIKIHRARADKHGKYCVVVPADSVPAIMELIAAGTATSRIRGKDFRCRESGAE